MIPTKPGQIVRHNTEDLNEDLNINYVVLKIYKNTFIQYAEIQALNTGMDSPPVYTVSTNKLEVVEVNTQDMMGVIVNIVKDDDSVHLGRIVAIPQVDTYLDMNIRDGHVETNVYVTIIDNMGAEHSGYIIV